MIEVNQINNTEFDLKITAEGIYNIIYVATDSQGRQYTDTIAIAAISRETIDNLLKGKWGLMKTALGNGEIENALIHFSENSKSKYRQIFTLLQNNISSIASGMQQIQLIYHKDGIAKYRIRRQEAQGEITYYIYFEQDKDGIWRIRQY